MKRTMIVLAAGVALCAPLLVVGAGPSLASPVAHGSATCRMALGGGGTVSPGLTPNGSPGGVKINFTAKLVPAPAAKSCNGAVTSPAGTKVIGGVVTGSGFYLPVPSSGNGSSCANFAGSDKVGNIKVVINWTTSGSPIAPTTIVYAGNPGTVTVSGGVDLITLNTPGSVTKSGSFAFPPTGAPHAVKFKTTLPGPGCGAGPFSSFHITGGAVSV
ncbi:MAG TPA: hypothetical protein VGO03_13600 [Acidimicrobiia bacterium]|jgi:hypothetical protein